MQYVKHKLYPKRWLVLATFVLLSASNAFHWIEYAAIGGTMRRYWSVGQNSINLFTVIYEATYLPGILPANWALDKCGLLWSCLFATALTLIASVLKLLANTPDGYWLAIGGQVCSGTGQLWILGIPPLLAGKWFGADEVGTATSLGVLGNQLGIGLGFIIPSLVVSAEQPADNASDTNATDTFDSTVQRELMLLSYGATGAILAVLALVVLVIRSAPPTPPSSAQEEAFRGGRADDGGLREIVTMFTMGRAFPILFVTYGINTGLFYGFSTIMDPIILHYFPHAGASVGGIGMAMIGCGIVGSAVVGPILDRTHKYKLITLIFYASACAFMAAFIAGLYSGRIWTLFLIAGALGFFNTGYLPLGFEFGVELTYPASEANVGGMLNWSAQALGIVLTYAGQYFIDIGQPIVSIALFAGSLALGLALTLLIPETLRRQAMERRASVAYSLSGGER